MEEIKLDIKHSVHIDDDMLALDFSLNGIAYRFIADHDSISLEHTFLKREPNTHHSPGEIYEDNTSLMVLDRHTHTLLEGALDEKFSHLDAPAIECGCCNA